MTIEARRRAATLACWTGPVDPEPLGGGISNHNFVVEDGGRRLMVRIGDDVPAHNVLRRFELAASRAAHAAGVSPEVVHAEPGALVFGYVEGQTLTAERVRQPAMLARIVELVRTVHHQIPKHFQGPAPLFWPFHAVRDYATRLRTDQSRMVPELPRLVAAAEALERSVGPIDLVFTHNDLLAANLIDDGRRLWLVDWEYGAFNSPLFDLANLASNNELSPEAEVAALEGYFAGPIGPGRRRGYDAMVCASLLREAMWSLVSEAHLTVDFDYRAYSDLHLDRFDRAYAAFDASG